MSIPNILKLSEDLRAIWDAWYRHNNLYGGCSDRMIFPEEFTDDPEIKEQILFYRLMRLKHIKIIFNGRRNESQTFYDSLEYALNNNIKPGHQLYEMAPFEASKLRCMAADYIEQNTMEFEEFEEFVELVESDPPEFCRRLRNNESWCGDLEIASIAEALRLNIQIFDYDLDKNKIFAKMFGQFIDNDIPTVSIGFRPIAKAYDSILYLNISC